MARWKLFGRSKSIDEELESEEPLQIESEETVLLETEQEPEDSKMIEYHETLYSKDSKSKKHSKFQQAYSDQRIWRDVNSIEGNIDDLDKNKLESSTFKLDDDINKTVDKLIEKRKFTKSKSQRKPSNVIYVVSKPQPGEVRGDWAVRSHGKIFSHHKTKEKAIEEARAVARKKDATVLVQNTDGTFSNGFKPR